MRTNLREGTSSKERRTRTKHCLFKKRKRQKLLKKLNFKKYKQGCLRVNFTNLGCCLQKCRSGVPMFLCILETFFDKTCHSPRFEEVLATLRSCSFLSDIIRQSIHPTQTLPMLRRSYRNISIDFIVI